MKKTLLISGLVASLLNGCTIASHVDKNRYWVMKDDIAVLPPIDVHAPAHYVSYNLLMERKRLFRQVSKEDQSPVDIEIALSAKPDTNVGLALSWLIVAGCSGYIIPYRQGSETSAEFVLKINGVEKQRFKYGDVKTTWISAFALLGGVGEKTDEYFVDELIADQYVNSFIIDLLKDKALQAEMRQAYDSYAQKTVKVGLTTP